MLLNSSLTSGNLRSEWGKRARAEKNKELITAQEQREMDRATECGKSELEYTMAGKTDHDHTEALQIGLASISKDIKDLQQNL